MALVSAEIPQREATVRLLCRAESASHGSVRKCSPAGQLIIVQAGPSPAGSASAGFAVSGGGRCSVNPGSSSTMPRPVMLAVDDDPDVLRAVERDRSEEHTSELQSH